MNVPAAIEKHIVASIPANERTKPLSGREKAAILLLSLSDKLGAPIWKSLDEFEVKQVSVAMATLGKLTKEKIEEVLVEFVTGVTSAQGMAGGYDNTERMLKSFMDEEQVSIIMEEIRGPAGRNMWEKLSNVPENILSSYLKNEYPQTVAVVLSKIRPSHAAKVLSVFPEEYALEVINRMLRMDNVQKEVLEGVEETLRTEFMSNLSQTRRRDSHEMMAEIFNSFDRQTEARFMTTLEEDSRDSAEKIKSLMFTFEDLSKLDSSSAQTLLRSAENDLLKLALKGAEEELREFFLGNMSKRQAENMVGDIEAMGPVRLKDVDEAQTTIVNLAKDLAAKGEIVINKGSDEEDEIVY